MRINKLLLLGLVLMAFSCFGQKKQKVDLDVHVFRYMMDSAWTAYGPPDTSVTILMEHGKVDKHQTPSAMVEFHVCQDESFRDRIIFLDPLFKVRDTLYVTMVGHLTGKEFIDLSMKGYLNKKDVNGENFDYFVHYITTNISKFVLYRRDYPNVRRLYFVHLVETLTIKK